MSFIWWIFNPFITLNIRLQKQNYDAFDAEKSDDGPLTKSAGSTESYAKFAYARFKQNVCQRVSVFFN